MRGGLIKTEERMPDPSLIRLEIAQSSKPTPSFRDWMQNRAAAANSQHQLGQITVKDEPLSPSTEQKSYLQTLESAIKDWVPNKPPNNKFLSNYASHDQDPAAMVPLSAPNQLKVSGQPSGILKKPRSGLKRKAQQGEPNESPSTSNIAKKLVCEICQIGCSSSVTMQQHLKGRPHKAKLEYMRSPKGKPGCHVCEIWCSDWAALEMHFKGQKHKAKVQEMEINGGLKMSKTPVMCQLCLVPCMNQDLYKMHLKGKQHAAKQELKRRGML